MNSYTVFLILLRDIFLFSLISSASSMETNSVALPGCPGKCGNLSIPFPFGTTPGCYLDDSFLIICNGSFNPPKPFSLQLGLSEVLSISLDGKIKVLKSSLELMELERRDRRSVPIVIALEKGDRRSVPMVMEWAAGNVACHVARENTSHYACQSLHSRCTDSGIRQGYICHCLPGYEGNPYLLDGCKDIDECAVSKPCEDVCINLPGSFKCYCPEGFVGDGRKDGTGCHPKYKVNRSASTYFPLVIIIVVAPAIAINWIVWTHKRIKLAKLRENLFVQNGGDLLVKKCKKSSLKIFTAEDMKAASGNYSSSRVVMHRWKPGTFYHGILADNDRTEVLIMKIQGVAESQIKQFVGQLIFLSEPHGNILRIIGCCLETASPLIVYELPANDGNITLSDHLCDPVPFSFEMRVKTAAGAARALAHFHSRGKLVHGNVTSDNILLNNSYNAKLFYAVGSSPIPPDITCLKDIYSFGLVLAELLKGENGFSSDDGNLILNFVSSVSKGSLTDTLDDRLVAEGDDCLAQVKEFAMLAERCLNVESERRLKMKEVEAKLSTLLRLQTGQLLK